MMGRMDPTTTNRHFKVCGSCRQPWATWDEFVADPAVRLLGLQAVTEVPEASVLVFEHGCGSSVSVLTKRLYHLLPHHPSAEFPSLRGTEACARHCFALGDHAACDRLCVHGRDRDLLKMVEALHADRGGSGR